MSAKRTTNLHSIHMAEHFKIAILALALFLPQAGCASLQSSRIIDERSSHLQKLGDGPGRPLYTFSVVEVPNMKESGASGCVALTMEPSTSSLQVLSTPVTSEVSQDHIAKACFTNSLASSGWNHLNVKTTDDQDIPLVVRAYSAGVVEGLITYDQIGAFSKTVSALLKKDTDSSGNTRAAAAVDRVLRASLSSWEKLTGGKTTSPPKDEIAAQAWACLIQLRGIRDGHNMLASIHKTPTLSMHEMMLMNMHTELPGIVELHSQSEPATDFTSLLQTGSHFERLGGRRQPRAAGLSSLETAEDAKEGSAREASWASWASHMPQGSALVRRVGPDGTPEDMITGHVTHGNYGEMLRIMKTYHLRFNTSVDKVTMSSYPACISSTDDFLITDKGFVLMSTNLGLPKTGEFSQPSKTKDGLPGFLRATVATRLAVQLRIWAKIYGSLSGIAGAKQWLIADYGKFKGHQPVANETVLLVEALPRLLRLGDVSTTLRTNGFFEVHGVPHFRQIREIFGFPAKGAGSSTEHLASALLDKAATVDSLAMARAMLSEVTPIANSDATGTVSPHRTVQIPITSRNDLDSLRPVPEGGIDAKVTSRCLVKDLQLQAISGPPATQGVQPFDWGAIGDDWPRNALPQRWDFTWINAGAVGVPSAVDDTRATCDSPDITES